MSISTFASGRSLRKLVPRKQRGISGVRRNGRKMLLYAVFVATVASDAFDAL